MNLLLVLVSSWGFAWGGEFQGKAFDLKTDQLLYIEKHKTQEDQNGFNIWIETDYLNSEGNLIAKIRSDFNKNKFIPDVVFEDLRNQLKEVQIFDLQKNEVTFIRTDLKTNKTKSQVLSVKTNMLAGQGFNNFLRANFEELKNGKSIHVNFIVLSSQDYFQFDIRRKSQPKDGFVHFGLSVSNYFLKIFVKEIETSYAIDNQRLYKFKGLSNLHDEKGRPLKVRIVYEYK